MPDTCHHMPQPCVSVWSVHWPWCSCPCSAVVVVLGVGAFLRLCGQSLRFAVFQGAASPSSISHMASSLFLLLCSAPGPLLLSPMLMLPAPPPSHLPLLLLCPCPPCYTITSFSYPLLHGDWGLFLCPSVKDCLLSRGSSWLYFQVPGFQVQHKPSGPLCHPRHSSGSKIGILHPEPTPNTALNHFCSSRGPWAVQGCSLGLSHQCIQC